MGLMKRWYGDGMGIWWKDLQQAKKEALEAPIPLFDLPSVLAPPSPRASRMSQSGISAEGPSLDEAASKTEAEGE